MTLPKYKSEYSVSWLQFKHITSQICQNSLYPGCDSIMMLSKCKSVYPVS